jgi:hypothetical protein
MRAGSSIEMVHSAKKKVPGILTPSLPPELSIIARERVEHGVDGCDQPPHPQDAASAFQVFSVSWEFFLRWT